MDEKILYGIYFFPGAAMHRVDVLEQLVSVLAGADELEPQTWGMSENARLPFDGDELVAMMSADAPGLKQTHLHRRSALVYDAYFDNGERPTLRLSARAGYSRVTFQTVCDFADRIAAVVQPTYGTVHVFPPPKEPWESEAERLHLWMDFAAQAQPRALNRNGPPGLGIRTYFGGALLDFVGKATLASAPVDLVATPWGGVRLDLIGPDMEPDTVTVLPRWHDAMTYLVREGVVASPDFHEDREVVKFLPSARWKDRAR